MSIELKIPDVGESIQEVQIGQWLKQEGDEVQQDENIVELETDKASMDLPAPTRGRLSKILKQGGDLVSVGETIAYIEESNGESQGKGSETSKQAAGSSRQEAPAASRAQADEAASDGEVSGPAKETPHDADDGTGREVKPGARPAAAESVPVTPSGRRALRKHGLTAEEIKPHGKRIRRKDVEQYVAQHDASQEAKADERGVEADERGVEADERDVEADERDVEARAADDGRPELPELEELVPMSLIRRRIAERLVEAQQKAALLTTFNQIDMSQVIELRQRHQKRFQERYEVKLGFMSFFVKAAVDALKQFPDINAEIRGSDILYRNYYHIGIAIGSGKGLVAPVLRHAERMSFAEIERGIADFAQRARNNKIGPDELQGGTFTISNGGIYGSLLSTPIVNPPQSGVLGMHAIEERPVAHNGEVVIRPMMYVALTYDHRIVDGAQAVTFLKRIREAVEEPARMLMEV